MTGCFCLEVVVGPLAVTQNIDCCEGVYLTAVLHSGTCFSPPPWPGWYQLIIYCLRANGGTSASSSPLVGNTTWVTAQVGTPTVLVGSITQ